MDPYLASEVPRETESVAPLPSFAQVSRRTEALIAEAPMRMALSAVPLFVFDGPLYVLITLVAPLPRKIPDLQQAP